MRRLGHIHHVRVGQLGDDDLGELDRRSGVLVRVGTRLQEQLLRVPLDLVFQLEPLRAPEPVALEPVEASGALEERVDQTDLGGLTLARAAQVDGVTLRHQELLGLIIGVERNERVAVNKPVFCGARGTLPARGRVDALHGGRVVPTAVEPALPRRRHRGSRVEATVGVRAVA